MFKKIIFTLFLFFIPNFLWGESYQDFLIQLERVGIDVDEFLLKPQISRYDLTRLLNLVDCKDCLNPQQDMIQSYTGGFWDMFSVLPGKDFEDILFRQGWYNQKSYYYCVAYVGDNGYMRGYPKATSPLCPGRFCGTNATTKAELLQVVLNIIGKYIAPQYKVNWSNVKKWSEGLQVGSYADRNLDPNLKKALSGGFARCGENECNLVGYDELKTYMAYCMFNMNTCGFQNFNNIKEGSWPVAELNVLRRANIDIFYQTREVNVQTGDKVVTDTEVKDLEVRDIVSGEEAVRTFYKAYQVVKCSFNNDYDCDGILNNLDNCPNHYNSFQRDLDVDGVGDVCDDDIDGDGIFNPVGIVDDGGRVDISLWSGNNDNCILVPNTSQEDGNGNGLGNVCDDKQQSFGLSIRILSSEKVGTSFRVKAEAIGVGDGIYKRTTGDGETRDGKIITYVYEKPGIYLLKVAQEGISFPIISQATIKVGIPQTDYFGASVIGSSLIGGTPRSVNLVANKVGDISDWERGYRGGVVISDASSLSRTFDVPGVVFAQILGKKSGTTIVAAGLTLGENSLQMKPSKIIFKQGESAQFQLLLGGVLPSEVLFVDWYYDEFNVKNTQTNGSYSFTVPGRKLIKAYVQLKNGRKLLATSTIYISSLELENSQGITLIPSGLQGVVNSNLSFSVDLSSYLPGQVDSVVWNVGNGASFIDSNPTNGLLTRSFSFSNPGIYQVKATVYAKGCHVAPNYVTVSIQDTKTCIDYAITGKTKLICDLDTDGIPDMCDSDVDGDGVKNLLGMIVAEQSGCVYDGSNVNDNLGNIRNDVSKNSNESQNKPYGCSLDNCLFLENPNQFDGSDDGVGDICQGSEILVGSGNGGDDNGGDFGNGGGDGNPSDGLNDRDGDGISDDKDLCPDVPENYNGIEDLDGCPEIGDQNCTDWGGVGDIGLPCGPDQSCLSAVNCNSCPCQFADFGGSLVLGDKIRAGLYDPLGNSSLNFSLEYLLNK